MSEKVLQEKMENASKSRVTEISLEIQDTIRETEEQNRSLAEAMKNGESKKSWMDGQLKKYITKAVELTGDAPKVTSNGRNNGFTIAGKNWKGQALSDREARLMREDLEQDRDSGIKTAVACSGRSQNCFKSEKGYHHRQGRRGQADGYGHDLPNRHAGRF